MIKLFKPDSVSGDEPLVTTESVDAALKQVIDRVTDDEPALMSLAEDLRFVKDPAKGEHRLESGYLMVVE